MDELTANAHRLKVRVLKKDRYWIGLSDAFAGGSTADTLAELFAEIEFFKHSRTGFAGDAPVCVEYIAGQPGIAQELSAVYAAYLALPPDLRPIAVPWDLDNDRPTDPGRTGPYTNPDQLKHLEQLHVSLGLTAYQG